METSSSPLILTKLRAPASRQRTIPRPHLVGRLEQENGASIFLVSAPAGYGKTTLLADWANLLSEKGTAVAWYSLDEFDDNPILFGSYLVASLAQALDLTTETTHVVQLLRSSPDADLVGILPAVINAIAVCNRSCTLILDDYHLIGSPEIHSAVAFLLEHLPENLRVAIGSRSDPPLPLARMRARRQMIEIRAGDLEFNEVETSQYLNEILQLGLSSEGVAALEERTEGWVAGLQLAGLSLAGRADKESFIASFSGSNRYLGDYLLEEVFNHQTAKVQSFLLCTSILERMCAPLCDALLGENTWSQAILEQLDRANLFTIALDDQNRWYRYHHLFKDFLFRYLAKTRLADVTGLHRAASAWLAANDLLHEAAQHAFQTQDWNFAAAFVEQNSFTMIIHSEISTIYEWCSAFPEEVMQTHPMLCIFEALSLAYSFRRRNKPKVEARLEQAEASLIGMNDPVAATEMNDFAAVVRTFMAMAPDLTADPYEQLVNSQRRLAEYPEGDPGQFSFLLICGYAYLALYDVQAAEKAFESARQIAPTAGLLFGMVESAFHLAKLAQSQGLFVKAISISRQSRAEIEAMLKNPALELPALGVLDIVIGCIQLERNQLDMAERNLLSGLEWIGWGMNPYYLMTALTALFRLREIQGRSNEALDFLTRLEELWPDILFCTHGLRVVHRLKTAPKDPTSLSVASAWAHGFAAEIDAQTFSPGLGPFGAAEAYYLTFLSWAFVEVAAGRSKSILPILKRQIEKVSARGLTSRIVELSLLEAQALEAQGEHESAVASLGRALAAAEPAGFVHTFNQGQAMLKLLADASDQGICRDYIERILAAIEQAKIPVGEASEASTHPGSKTALPSKNNINLIEPLSARELEVLQLIAQGASNRAIADRLVITVGTVKSHINHIFGKLDAHSRTEALAKARDLDLLDL